jgi:hypothetical protein
MGNRLATLNPLQIRAPVTLNNHDYCAGSSVIATIPMLHPNRLLDSEYAAIVQWIAHRRPGTATEDRDRRSTREL